MTNTTELDITDPHHPLHRAPATKPAATAPATEAKPMTTETPAKPKKAKAAKTGEAKVKAKKAAKPAKDADAPKNPRSIVPVRFKEQYAATNDTCGDKLSLALKEATTTTNKDGRECLDVETLVSIAKANKVWDEAKYGHLNNGQKRMNVRNKLAGLLKNGTTVVVGKQKFANAEKALAKQAVAA